jgi:hypothetical protein
VGNKTKEVATSVAMPRHVLHNNPIPVEYAKVLVWEITGMGYIDYPLDHVTPEGVKELTQAINQFILWNWREIFLDGLISPQRQRVQLGQTLTSSPVAHALATPPGQQEAQQLPTPHTEIEAQQLPCPQQQIAPTETEAPKDNEASPIQGMPRPASSPHDTIHEDLGLYKTKPRSDPTDHFFAAMRNLKSPMGISSTMSPPAQRVDMYMRACKIESYEEDGEVYNREKLLVWSHDPIFMKEHVPEKFVFGKPFLTTAQLSKRPFPLRRLYNWYMTTNSLDVTNITFEIPGNAFYCGARIGSIDFEDLWFMFHQKWLDMNLLVIFCL